jgi:hypothetical protein
MICSNRYEARSGPARELWLPDRNSKPDHGEQLGSLKGKTALVTGSRSGMGLACARAFASAGSNIVFNCLGAPAEVEKERSAIKTISA